jgi:zinc protease
MTGSRLDDSSRHPWIEFLAINSFVDSGVGGNLRDKGASLAIRLFVAIAILIELGVVTAAQSNSPVPRKKSATASVDIPIPDIPYTKFVLANGLTVLVHEDHKIPMVAVNTWYHVGSKNEKLGKT